MPRRARSWIDPDFGSYHIISRTAGKRIWFDEDEKEILMNLLQHFASGFYVKIHFFCIMSTHFHILLSSDERSADSASEKELLRRYHRLYGKDANPPTGSVQSDGTIKVDDDGGIDRLRNRLGSVSRFVQEFKQTFSRWYNKRYDRKGYLWGERFKDVIVEKGESELVCGAYIDLNPVRGGMVTRPEDYRWSSMGMRVRNVKRYRSFITSIFCDGFEVCDELLDLDDKEGSWTFYRRYVYESGGVEVESKGRIGDDAVGEVLNCSGRYNVVDKLRCRVRNLSEGVAIGGRIFISDIQKRLGRKHIRPRRCGLGLYVTRVLRL